ncbi:MAG: aspartate/glutamate racemase family protein [Desulfovibrio sp.]|nr:aspartate/glutamate racemase family protein [Desulfovibrio sp.]
MIVQGGKNIYGYDLGILMLESHFPRIVGDVGNARTWDFPVLYKVVKGSLPHKVVLDLNDEDLQPFVLAAQELEAQGVRAITTSCGFLSLFQQKLANVLHIPLFTSALMLLPSLLLAFQGKKLLILTANSQTLTDRHLQAVGIDNALKGSAFDIVGTQDKEMFTNFTVQNWQSVDTEVCAREILDCLEAALSKEQYAGILLECTNMPPYSDRIRQKFHLPVFDFVSLVNFVHSSMALNGFVN